MNKVFTLFCAFIVLLVFGAMSTSAQTFTFSNTSSITIGPGVGGSSVYPSDITVPGLCCQVARVTVTLNDFSHTLPDDVGVLLVGPGGQKVRLMADVGGSPNASNADITFDDRAAGSLPNDGTLTTGTFKPTLGTSGTLFDGNTHPASFPGSAPAAPYSSVLSDFIGTSPNGTWSLYIDDDTSSSGGTLAGGWTLNITLGRVFTNTGAITIPGSGTGPGVGSLYSSDVTVAGVGVVTKITVRLNDLTHAWPDDIGVLLVGPSGQNVRLMIDTGGGNGAEAVTGAFLTFDDTAAAAISDTSPPPSSTYLPSIGVNNEGGNFHPANFPLPAPAGPYGTSLAVFNGTNPNGTWSLYVDDDSASDLGAMAGGWTLIIEAITLSAAGSDIRGRVANSSGRGIPNAVLQLSGGSLPEPRFARTNAFGFYAFTDIPTGQAYVVTVAAKAHTFAEPSRVISLDDDIAGFDFTADPPR